MNIPRTLATTNPYKEEEWRRIMASLPGGRRLAIDRLEGVDLLEVQSLDPVKVAIIKARHAAAVAGMSVLVDDSAFGLPELGGFPGAMYRDTAKSIGLSGLLHLADSTAFRKAVATTTIAFADNDGVTVYVVRADVQGHVSHGRRGSNGFDFDAIFVPDGQGTDRPLTYGEMPMSQKRHFSMRSLAIGMLLRREWETHRVAHVESAVA